jgi:RNA polymerase sigma-70 factor, ECF subfamily
MTFAWAMAAPAGSVRTGSRESADRVEAPDPSDAVLIERVAERDTSAFEELYGRFARAVLGLALRRLHDRGAAEDATQEAFAAIWRSAATYDPDRGPGSAWIYTVARNAIVDRTRRRREPLAGEAREEASSEAGPAERTESDWVTWRVHAALARLVERERVVIELAYFSELSQSEIAAFLDIPLGTVKTRTRSALSRLADDLEDDLQ